jgi:hypothetical protein
MENYRFFISRAGADKDWAYLISEVLKELGHETFFQDQNSRPGLSIIEMMEDGAESDCTIAVISESYFKSKHCRMERNAALHSDPNGRLGRFIPVLVSPCRIPPIMADLAYVSLVDLDKATARQRLMEVLRDHTIQRYEPKIIAVEPVQSISNEVELNEAQQATITPDTSLNDGWVPSSEVQSDEFSAVVKDQMTKLKRKVDRLTGEQYRVIMQLMGCKRVRISGCAGSGKTSVAVEKAVRSAKNNQRTLFLCHSPLLADDIRPMTSKAPFRVEDFGDWVRRLAGTPAQYDRSAWTNYDEPEPQLLARALEALLASNERYDCVIVDEGQDFREEWWTIVEAALVEPKSSSLYIFHDDNQAILPYRSTYPINETVLDLSRNCRNSGRIYDLMRVICPAAPDVEKQLRNLGAARLFTFERDNSSQIISNAIAWLLSEGFAGDHKSAADNIVALHGGTAPIANSPLIGTFRAGVIDWQTAVRNEFKRAMDIAESLRPPAGGWPEVFRVLSDLSNNHRPTSADVDLVRNVAKSFTVSPNTRRLITNRPGARAGLSWILTDKLARLSRSGFGSFRASEIIVHFEREDWDETLPIPQEFVLEINGLDVEPGHIPIYRVADYKGLESDCILLLIQGNSASLERELYVGISRARRLLAFLLDRSTIASLPRGLRPRWENEKK